MAKKITRVMTITAMAGQASLAKLGQKPGPFGIGAKLCQKFNAETEKRKGELVPCILTIYEDRTFDIQLKTSPVFFLLEKAAKIQKGAATHKTAIAHIAYAEIEKIAKYKLPDLNVKTEQAAINCVLGTAKSMGIAVDGIPAATAATK